MWKNGKRFKTRKGGEEQNGRIRIQNDPNALEQWANETERG